MKLNIKIKVGGYAEICDGYHNGQIVFLKEKLSGGYMCKGFGMYAFEGFELRKSLKEVSIKKIYYINQMLKRSKDEVSFYTGILNQFVL